MTSTRSLGVGITGLGKYIPKQKVTTEEVATRLNVSRDDILKRTGIQTRFFASKEESASWMSTEAAKEAIQNAKIQPEDIGLVIALTTSGDYVFPALAAKIQHLIGAKNAGAFDVSASASSFPVAMSLASDRLKAHPELHHILVVGTAVQSPYIDWENKQLAAILGDGSGAAILSRVPESYGVIASEIYCDGSNYEAARLRGGGSMYPLSSENIDEGLQYIEMDGVAMGREFLKRQPIVIEKALKQVGLTLEDVKLFLFHQANLRLIQFVMDRMKQPIEKTVTNAEVLGNTAEASIPTVLFDAVGQKSIQRDDIVVLSGVGAGSIIAVTVLKWH